MCVAIARLNPAKSSRLNAWQGWQSKLYKDFCTPGNAPTHLPLLSTTVSREAKHWSGLFAKNNNCVDATRKLILKVL